MSVATRAPVRVYFHVEGSDLHAVAPLLRERFAAFIASRSWSVREVGFIDEIHPRDSPHKPGDLDDWSFGLDLDVSAETAEGEVDDVRAVVEFLQRLHIETGRDFVIGVVDPITHVTDDLFYVDASPLDFDEMRFHLGLGAG